MLHFFVKWYIFYEFTICELQIAMLIITYFIANSII